VWRASGDRFVTLVFATAEKNGAPSDGTAGSQTCAGAGSERWYYFSVGNTCAPTDPDKQWASLADLSVRRVWSSACRAEHKRNRAAAKKRGHWSGCLPDGHALAEPAELAIRTAAKYWRHSQAAVSFRCGARSLSDLARISRRDQLTSTGRKQEDDQRTKKPAAAGI